VTFLPGSGGGTLDRLKTNDRIDVIVLEGPQLKSTGESGQIRPETIVMIGDVRLGMAVRAGAPVPDISTPDRLRAVVAAAKAVSHSNPGGGSTSAAHTLRIFKELGIAEEAARKTKLVGAKGLASGEVDIHFQPISELMPAPGITIVGPVPEQLGARWTMGAAMTARAVDETRAREFLRYLARPESAAVFKARGVTPAR
jgi:molybdate transport system substrate-binding protein